MKGEYREISADLLALAHGNAWSIENMEAHEAGGRSVDYIGSRTERKHSLRLLPGQRRGVLVSEPGNSKRENSQHGKIYFRA